MDQNQLYAQIEELKRRMEVLAHENADLRVSRDIAWAKVRSLLPKATPVQEAAFRKDLAGEWHEFGTVIDEITAELRAGYGD